MSNTRRGFLRLLGVGTATAAGAAVLSKVEAPPAVVLRSGSRRLNEMEMAEFAKEYAKAVVRARSPNGVSVEYSGYDFLNRGRS